MRTLLKRLIPAIVTAALMPGTAAAQLEPHARWRTIETPHFRVHFTSELEALARRSAAVAESAWVRLARDFVPPRGPVDLVVADNVDFSNGYAGVYPTNRMVVYAHPPVTSSSLRWADDWSTLLITHELTHLFHLDRSRGWWRAAQLVFGRDPIWFPNLYLPAWIVEGLAVHEESRLTGAGRAHGSHQLMVARAAALGAGLPRLDELSLDRTAFPRGEVTYVFGGILFDHLARVAGEQAVARFVERTAAAPIPFLLNAPARRAFGVGFEKAWQTVRDSLAGAAAPPMDALVGVRALTGGEWFAVHPRWIGGDTLVYVGTSGRESNALVRLTTDGRRTRLGDRNGLDPNDPLPDGGFLYSEPDYVTPYVVRADLWTERAGRRTRLTRGARLTWPDARSDGTIVATQAVRGGTRLVLLDAAGRSPRALTPDDGAWWSQARWNPDGTRLVAVRQRQGPHSEVVLLDTSGVVLATLAGGRAILSSPVWDAAGSRVYFTSDAGGATQLYVVPVAGDRPVGAPVRVSDAATGIFSPAPHPAGDSVAASLYLATGYQLVLGRPHDSLGVHAPDSVAGGAAPGWAVTPSAAASRRYSPWRSLAPRYWRLLFAAAADETLVGAVTTGVDVVGRHDYFARAYAHLERPEWDWAAAWSWRGLGLPIVDADMSQRWTRFAGVVDSAGRALGAVRERARDASLSLLWTRPRVRTSFSVRLGATGSWQVFVTEPDSLLVRIDPVFSRQLRVFGGYLAASWVYGKRPPLAISLEDGLRLTALARHRRDPDDGASWNGGVGSVALYKSLDLPGRSHHVLAARVSAGAWDENSRNDFAAGGITGQSLEVVPGLTIGGGSSSFPVRGFVEGARRGTRALAGSVEYRAPLFAPGRGWRLLPVFLDRASLVLFGDGAVTRCPSGTPACAGAPAEPDPIASVGGELWIDTALQYDLLHRFRLGAAWPVAGDPSPSVSAFVTLGTSF